MNKTAKADIILVCSVVLLAVVMLIFTGMSRKDGKSFEISVGGKVYGNMLLNIPGGPDELAAAVKFLKKTPNVTVQVDVEYDAEPADGEEAEPRG